MVSRIRRRSNKRVGAIVVLAAVLMTFCVGALAFSIDYGLLLKARTDLQRAADASALAAVQELFATDDGTQDLSRVRDMARTYVNSNTGGSFTVPDADIEIGRFDPAQIYTNVVLLNDGVFDAVRITLRRDGTNNPAVPFYFAPLLGMQNAPVAATATAVLQKATRIPDGSDILPFTVPQTLWDSLGENDEWIVYGDGKLEDPSGNEVPGHWGTVDIGGEDNSTADLVDQIENGLQQSDLDSLYDAGTIPQSTHIDANEPAWLSGDTGLSSGIKDAVRSTHGTSRIVPIYDTIGGSPLAGENLQFHIVAWGVVTVVDSGWQGAQNTHVTLQKSYIYDGDLRPHPDLSNTADIIDGAYTMPVLVE